MVSGKKAEIYRNRLEKGIKWNKKEKTRKWRMNMNTENKFNDQLIRLPELE